MRLLIAVATYNEIENLPPLATAIRDAAPAADVLVVDDDSPDGTGAWCDAEAARSPWFTVIHRAGKLGLGSASRTALQAAIERGYDAVATIDADWSHPPAALPALLAKLEDVEVVIGSRYCPGGRIEGWPLSRRVVSRAMNLATRLCLGLPVKDASTAYRVYRVGALQRLDFSLLTESGYGYLEEILWRLDRAGAAMAEVPIAFTDRRAGTSKVNLGEAFGKLCVLGRLAGERFRRRPRLRDASG